jgi:hypothetical protein
VITPRKMRWGGKWSIPDMRNAYKILVEKQDGKYHSKDLRVDGKIL